MGFFFFNLQQLFNNNDEVLKATWEICTNNWHPERKYNSLQSLIIYREVILKRSYLKMMLMANILKKESIQVLASEMFWKGVFSFGNV